MVWYQFNKEKYICLNNKNIKLIEFFDYKFNQNIVNMPKKSIYKVDIIIYYYII